VSPAYVVQRPREGAHPRYLHHLLRTPAFAKEAERWSYGITSDMWSLRPEHFKMIYGCLPPLTEQSAIVRFLDYVDRRIRRYIRAKKKLIELLKEQKQAIIHRAVTRGLDPNVRLKPSGVEWLGDVPEHWKVLRVKRCAQIISKGTTPSTEGREILESGSVRFLKAENVAGGRIVDKPLCFIDKETNDLLLRSQLKLNDVLFVIAGATLGKTAVVDREILPANTNQAVAFVRPNKRIVSSYLALWLQSPRVKELTWLNAVQSAQPNLSMADLGSFLVPLPPVPEQHGILVWLSDAVIGLDKAVHRAQREIELLREYRTRLIADVVTGKLDVRESAARLSHEADEPEPLDDAEALVEGDESGEDTDINVAPEEAEA
jgi:type I restriction enzyme S subunit